MEEIFSRHGMTLTIAGQTATIPQDVTALSILATNGFTPEGEYINDGYIYVGGKPVKKWFKTIDDVKVWFPIMENIQLLQHRYNLVKERYFQYAKKYNLPAFDAVIKAGKAHCKITHKFEGNYPPWWLYRESHGGITFDWVDEPKEPINLDIGNRYYQTTQRLEQLGSRWHKFNVILMQSISSKLYEVSGQYGDLLQVKVLDNVYWYQHKQYTWELITKDDNFKTIEL
jgi:hypothetical protein